MPSSKTDLNAQSAAGDPGELTEVLAEAALDGRLSWQCVDRVLTILERYQHLASQTFWSCYLALDGQPPAAAAAEEAA